MLAILFDKNILKMNTSLLKEDNFMKAFKYYKLNNPKPSLSEVLSTDYRGTDKLIAVSTEHVKEDIRAELLGLHNCKSWKTYVFKRHPGLLLIKNPFTSNGQRYWIRQCLEVYPRKPNKLNIDSEICVQDWWAECFRNEQSNEQLQKKLRWTTLGYHHDWDTKIYSNDNKAPFPENLAELSHVVARYLGYEEFRAEAAIVNYYHMNSTLSAHTDHSEVNLDAPLFSFSFGQSAIFLLGGHDKSIEPSAILLKSGDIVVMSKESRLCYHAVPKILPSTSSPWNEEDFQSISTEDVFNSQFLVNGDNLEWSRCKKYIQKSRININVRQVLNENQMSLDR